MDKRFLMASAVAVWGCQCLFGTLSAHGQPNGKVGAIMPLADGYNEFGFKLLRRVAAGKKNASVCVSPYSVASALALAHSGAAGRTRQEIAQLLGAKKMTPAQLNVANRELSALMTKAGPHTRVAVANGVWTNKSAAIKPQFLKNAQQFFAARTRSADFASPSTLRGINDFVRQNTGGKIPGILDALDSSGVLVLVNAVYFKGQWQTKFDPAKTRPGPFFSPSGQRSVPFMEQTGDFNYVDAKQAQVLTLPYEGGRYQMTIALPKGKISVDALLNSLDAKTWREWAQSRMPEPGTIKLPKVKLSASADLDKILAALGMKSAFSAQHADFSNLTPEKPVWISQVKHKTVIEVNESGTEAAGATGMTMLRGAAPTPFTFIANRPFVMAIQESESGAILFLSRMSAP